MIRKPMSLEGESEVIEDNDWSAGVTEKSGFGKCPGIIVNIPRSSFSSQVEHMLSTSESVSKDVSFVVSVGSGPSVMSHRFFFKFSLDAHNARVEG